MNETALSECKSRITTLLAHKQRHEAEAADLRADAATHDERAAECVALIEDYQRLLAAAGV